MEPFLSASSLSFCSFHGRPVGSCAASHSQNSFHFFCAHAVWKRMHAACHTAEPPGTRRECSLSRVLLTPATRKIISDQCKVELGRGPCVPMCVHACVCVYEGSSLALGQGASEGDGSGMQGGPQEVSSGFCSLLPLTSGQIAESAFAAEVPKFPFSSGLFL